MSKVIVPPGTPPMALADMETALTLIRDFLRTHPDAAFAAYTAGWATLAGIVKIPIDAVTVRDAFRGWRETALATTAEALTADSNALVVDSHAKDPQKDS
jgi:hypothetical protein